jgi:hypothetical protein
MSRQSATVIAFGEYRGKERPLYFTRSELNALLGLYSRHVTRGEWRDYAIDHCDGMALFSVFRHSHEGPLFRIVKTAGAPAEFALFRGRRRLRKAASLTALLVYFERPLSLVPAASG